MKCKFCGGNRFYAHQEVRMDVIVDEDGDYMDGVTGTFIDIYDSSAPYGPYQCCKCGAEYDVLADGEEAWSGPVVNWKEHHEEGVCPICGEAIEVVGHEENGYGEMTGRWKCGSCGAFGMANYVSEGYRFEDYDIESEGS